MGGGGDRLGGAELGPHAPKELAEVTLRAAERRRWRGEPQPMLRPCSASKFSGNELGSTVSERPVFISILRN